MNLRNILSLFLITTLVYTGFAQRKKKEEVKQTPAVPAGNASPKAETPKAGPKAYKEVITAKAKSQKGLFSVHKLDDKYFFEIPDSVLNKEIMAVTRFVKTPTGAGYGGEELNRQVLRFVKGPENKLFLKLVTYINVSPDSTQHMSKAVENSNAEPIVAAFDIKASRKDTSSVIEVTDFFKADNQVVSLSPIEKQLLKITTLAADRSYIDAIKAYPINIEVKSVKTFNTAAPSIMPSPMPTPGVQLPQGLRAGVVTAEINTSFILLPAVKAPKRMWDPRVGYFANRYTVYTDDSHQSKEETFIVRWKLEPKSEEDKAKQKAGQLIEPKKPIVYYIDPATPKRWVPYLIAGINDWQKAFEQAGWKNAIMGKELTEADSLISPEDARYSFIRYFASNIENAYGPNVYDPRTGEILESHIGWYHNVMSLLYKWYLIQTAACDPAARKPKFDDELMGQLIRFVSSHEVGHTLGLPHNFGSSHATPVEKLRDKKYIAENGHTPSIMDYARFNYVAQPEDGITDFFPRIGEYDRWSIEWGYKPIYEGQEQVVLNQWVLSHSNDPKYFYGTQGNPYDPRSQSECLGDNNMKAGDYGIKNLKRIVPNLAQWTAEPNEDFDKLGEVYREVVGQYRRYMGHVLTNVGGVYDSPKTVEQTGPVYEPTPRALQKDAMRFLNEHAFTTPKWLMNADVLGKIGPNYGVEQIKNIQETLINGLFDSFRMQRLIEAEANFGTKAYTLDDLFSDTKNGIFSEVAGRATVEIQRRNLQRIWVEKLIALVNAPSTGSQSLLNFPGFRVQPSPNSDPKKSDVGPLARAYLNQLKSELSSAKTAVADKMTKIHFDDLQKRIENGLEPK